MGERIRALADPNPVDQLACLVLRVLAELSPCTERSFLEHLWKAAETGQVGIHIRDSLLTVRC